MKVSLKYKRCGVHRLPSQSREGDPPTAFYALLWDPALQEPHANVVMLLGLLRVPPVHTGGVSDVTNLSAMMMMTMMKLMKRWILVMDPAP